MTLVVKIQIILNLEIIIYGQVMN